VSSLNSTIERQILPYINRSNLLLKRRRVNINHVCTVHSQSKEIYKIILFTC